MVIIPLGRLYPQVHQGKGSSQNEMRFQLQILSSDKDSKNRKSIQANSTL